MKFIITEEDKKHIKQLYGLLSEQNKSKPVEFKVFPIPDNILEYTPEQWSTWFDENIKKGFVSNTLRIMVDNRIPSKPQLLLSDGIRSIAKTNEDADKFNKLLRAFNTSTELSITQRDATVSAFEVAQNIAKEVYNKWNENLKNVMELTITEKTETVAGETIGGTVEFPIDWNPDTNVQLYDNNLWKVSTVFQDSFKKNIVNKINLLKEKFPNIPVSLISLDIQTSASRYRNTGQAAELSFQELSRYRNNSAKNEILTTLEANGVTNIKAVTPTQQYLGGNGDGTTGPNPPEPNAYVNGGNVKMNTTPTEPRNQFGEPLSTPEEYNQYKYLKVTIRLAATLPEEEPEQESINVFSYELKIGEEFIPPPPPVKRPKPKGKTPSMNFRNKIASLLQIDPEKCAAYD